MVKTYFTYNTRKAINEGASKAFLSTEAGGGSFLFTDQIVSSKTIENSQDGNIKVVQSYTREEYLKSIAGIEEAKNRKNDFSHLTSREEYSHLSSGPSSTTKVKNKIAEMREYFESHDDHIASSYDREETIHGFEGKLSRQRMKKSIS